MEVIKQKMRLKKEFKLLNMSQIDIGVILKTVRKEEDENGTSRHTP